MSFSWLPSGWLPCREAEPETFAAVMSRVFENCCKLLPVAPLRVRLGPGLELLGERLARRKDVTIVPATELFGLMVEVEGGHLHCDGSLPRLLQRLRQERGAELEAILFGGAS